MSLQEQYFPVFKRYPKKSATSIPAHVVDSIDYLRAEDKPNGGIIQSVADTRHLKHGGLSKAEHQKLVKQAKRDHKIAMTNVRHQDADNAKAIAKQITKWRKDKQKADKKTQMPSQRGQLFLDEIKAKGVYEVKDFKLSKVYLQRIIRQAKTLGYRIKPIKEGRTIVSYKLIEAQ